VCLTRSDSTALEISLYRHNRTTDPPPETRGRHPSGFGDEPILAPATQHRPTIATRHQENEIIGMSHTEHKPIAGSEQLAVYAPPLGHDHPTLECSL
jgi:hypothetical protein